MLQCVASHLKLQQVLSRFVHALREASLHSIARKDGTMIGILLSDTPLASRLRTTGVKYVATNSHGGGYIALAGGNAAGPTPRARPSEV